MRNEGGHLVGVGSVTNSVQYTCTEGFDLGRNVFGSLEIKDRDIMAARTESNCEGCT